MLETVCFVFLTVIIAFGALVTIANIGKPRKPITPGDAVAITVMNVLFYLSIVVLFVR